MMSSFNFDYVDEIDDVEEQITEDSFGNAAFKIGIIGIGQCGNNFVNSFAEEGYSRVLMINTTNTDVARISEEIPRYITGEGGAGKDPAVGTKSVIKNRMQIRAAIQRNCGDFNKLVICVGLGGGTGSGGCIPLIDICKELIKERGGIPEQDVIVIAVLPSPNFDGARPCYNTVKSYLDLCKSKIPFIPIDNAVMGKLTQATYADRWQTMNSWIVKTFHKFNLFGARPSDIASFDAEDFNKVLTGGRMIFSAFPIRTLVDGYQLSEEMIKYLNRSLFAKMDLSTATMAACLLVINPKVESRCTHEDMGELFATINNLMKDQSTLYQGIYIPEMSKSAQEKNPDLFCYVLLSGLDHPVETLRPIFEKAQAHEQDYSSFEAYLQLCDD